MQFWLAELSIDRPVFHSEADFQHALAWVARQCEPSLRVRLESSLGAGEHLDLLLSRPQVGSNFAIEVKYLTAGWTGSWDGEDFQLLDQGAQDIRAYDVVKDIHRIEQLVHGRPGWIGAVVVLTNEPSYWQLPGHTRETNADAFRLHEGSHLAGSRGWRPRTGVGTRKGRDANLGLQGEYVCQWSDYSHLDDPRGSFRMLTLAVDG